MLDYFHIIGILVVDFKLECDRIIKVANLEEAIHSLSTIK